MVQRLGQVVFKNHNSNPFQSSPSLPNFTYIKLAGADGPSIHPSIHVFQAVLFILSFKVLNGYSCLTQFDGSVH